ncbi:trypsin-like peptidase domain-containing protein [Gilvimarinus polysaccharolyticus]|uniref:trypsin-like peptidase domain-containing protein n=1 Tax=Gilvimarinus polysaccharolyticus TaxID=863921 RepID=UPI0006733A30|nr:trypsin-like peptidase domain-containing protein [Gilvimarinus polysaccharolyticus]
MPASRLLSFFAWPAVVGLLVALILLLTVPELRPDTRSHQTSSGHEDEHSFANLSYAHAVDQAASSVVNIYSRKVIETRNHPLANHPLYEKLFRNSGQQERVKSALGSGVIVSPEGYLLTNNHVIEGADEILVLLHDGRRASATFIGNDPGSDLAVLKIELANLTPITIGKPEQARVGDVVLAIGNPFGVGQTVTQGIISALSRYGLGISSYENYIQTDAAINPGNSGGALIDTHGHLLGINAAIIFDTVGIGFAVPADDAMKSLKDIIKYGRVVRGWLGLDAERLTPAAIKALGLQNVTGLRITNIFLNNPAHIAGLRPNDVITHINNQPIGNERQGLREVADLAPGTEVTVRILRPHTNGSLPEELEIKVTVGERPDNLEVNHT